MNAVERKGRQQDPSATFFDVAKLTSKRRQAPKFAKRKEQIGKAIWFATLQPIDKERLCQSLPGDHPQSVRAPLQPAQNRSENCAVRAFWLAPEASWPL